MLLERLEELDGGWEEEGFGLAHVPPKLGLLEAKPQVCMSVRIRRVRACGCVFVCVSISVCVRVSTPGSVSWCMCVCVCVYGNAHVIRPRVSGCIFAVLRYCLQAPRGALVA